MTQTEIVLDHLKTHEDLTALEAFNLYGIMRLASRVCELRKCDYNIVCVHKRVQTRYGYTSVACYKLIEEAEKTVCA